MYKKEAGEGRRERQESEGGRYKFIYIFINKVNFNSIIVQFRSFVFVLTVDKKRALLVTLENSAMIEMRRTKRINR